MAGYQFDELTKDLAGAKSRRGFLKGLLGAGLAAAGVGTVLSGVASAASCPPGGGYSKCPGTGTCCQTRDGSHQCCSKGQCCPTGLCSPSGGCKNPKS